MEEIELAAGTCGGTNRGNSCVDSQWCAIPTSRTQCKLTELSNLARFLLPPSTILSTLISALANCSLRALSELVTDSAPPSLSLQQLRASMQGSSTVGGRLVSRLLTPDRVWCFCAETLRRLRLRRGDALRLRAIRELGRETGS